MSLLHPNSHLFLPVTACLLLLLFTFKSHQRSRCSPTYGDVIVPMVMWSQGGRGWWSGVDAGLQRADFYYVMDPEIGHQILQAQPLGVLRNSFLTRTQMGSEPFKYINKLLAGCWLGCWCHFRHLRWWWWGRFIYFHPVTTKSSQKMLQTAGFYFLFF